MRGIDLSPAQILYGRILKDHMPSLPEVYNVREEWKLSADKREIALQKRNIKMIENYNMHTKALPELSIRDHVAVQNQVGHHLRRLDKTGTIVERLQHRQYQIKMDGSGRVNLRNGKFLRRILPVCCDPTVTKPCLPARSYSITETSSVSPPTMPPTKNMLEASLAGSDHVHNINNSPPAADTATLHVSPDHEVQMPGATDNGIKEPRRSTRNRMPRQLFSAQHRGNTHLYETS